MIAGQTVKLSVPHEEGTEFTLRSLGYRKLRDAQQAYLRAVSTQVSELDIAKLRDAMRDGDLDRDVTGDGETKSGEYAYDMDLVLEAGIVEWTYEMPLEPSNIALLDEETANWAFKAIVDMSRRTTPERKG